MAYSFDPIFAKDPSNPNVVAARAAITIFDPADTGKAPIAITDPTGVPLPNPITVDAQGMGPAFQHPTLARVGWHGGGFTNYFTSYEGLRDEAVAARTAAQTAQGQASSAAGEVVTTAAVNGIGKLILTKASGGTVDAGSVIGPKGDKGDKGADGLNGSNVLPTQQAIEQALVNAGPAKTALDNTYAGRKADLYADFTGVTSRPVTADSGQTFGYTYTGADKIVMQNGLLINDGTAGQYYMDTPNHPLAGPVTSVGVECVFFAGTESGMVYGSWSTPVTVTGGWSGQKSRVHAILYPGRLEYYVNATGSAPAAVLIKTQTLPTPLTQYADQAAWIAAGKPTNKAITVMSGDTAVTFINGVALPAITHAGINGTDRYPFWEAYKPVVGMKSLWAGTTPELLTNTPTGALAQAVATAQKKADDAYAAAPTEVVTLPPSAFTPRAGTPTLQSISALDVPHWAFDQTTQEGVRGYATVPKGWSTYDVVFVTANPTAAAGDVRLQASVHIVGLDGAASVGSNQTSPAAVYAAGAIGVRKDIVMASNVVRAATGEILITATRVAGDATDTLSADYAVCRVELRKKS